MFSKVPKLSIKIDQILLKRNESMFSVNVNSESQNDIFYDAANNSYGVTNVDENNTLSDANKNIIDELHDILSDNANFFPSDEVNGIPSSLSLDDSYENFENSDYLDYLKLDCPPVDASSSVSFPSVQLQGKRKCNSKEFCNCQLLDIECVNTFSTQLYSSNDIFENHYIYDGILDELVLDTGNDSEINSLRMARELKVAVVKLSDKEILSYVNPKIPENVENISYHSVLRKELRVVLKIMTNEEINTYINSSNKNIDIGSLKELKVSLTRITDVKSSQLVKENEDTLETKQDSGYYEENSIAIYNNSIILHSDNDNIVTNSLKILFGNTNNTKKLTVNCPRLDQDLMGVADQKQNLINKNNSEDLDCDVGSCNEIQKTVDMQSEKNNLRHKRKRKIEKDLNNDNVQTWKVFIHDGDIPSFNDNEVAVYKKLLIPFIKGKGTMILIQNETILKRSVRIYTATIYKILFAGKFVYNDHYKRTLENFGGKVVSDPKVATVLVAKRFKRTVEFLSAICRGIPTVSVDWIHECVENHGFVAPNNYLLKDTESEKKYEFNLKESLERAREKRIFEGYFFIITSGIQKKSFDQLKYLIEMAGGIVYKNISKDMKPPTIIVTCSKDEKKVRSLMKKKPNFFERTVFLNFITDCIIKQKICSKQV